VGVTVAVVADSTCAQVYRDARGIPMVHPADPYTVPAPRDLLTTVYDCGPVKRVWCVARCSAADTAG
jgi:hypothetical protein